MGKVVNATPRLLYSRERDPLPIVSETKWVPGLVLTGAKISHLPGFDPGNVYPVTRHYRGTHLQMTRNFKLHSVAI
jgi:hypothetical protein